MPRYVPYRTHPSLYAVHGTLATRKPVESRRYPLLLKTAALSPRLPLPYLTLRLDFVGGLAPLIRLGATAGVFFREENDANNLAVLVQHRFLLRCNRCVPPRLSPRGLYQTKKKCTLKITPWSIMAVFEGIKQACYLSSLTKAVLST